MPNHPPADNLHGTVRLAAGLALIAAAPTVSMLVPEPSLITGMVAAALVLLGTGTRRPGPAA